VSDVSQGPGWWQAIDRKWYPPQPAPGPPPRQEMSGCLKAFLIVAGVAGALVVLGAVLAGVGLVALSHAAKNATAQLGRPAAYSGPAYPGMQNLDHVAVGGGSVEDFGFTVTVSKLRRTVDLTASVCADVIDLNRSSQAQNYGLLDWRLQQPNGVVEGPGLGSTLQGGQLLQSASATGTICFADPGLSGQFIVIWRPVTFSGLVRGDRGIWLFNL
jgi:hypothetical protein